jgi:Ni/Co efflux regulator RcnB
MRRFAFILSAAAFAAVALPSVQAYAQMTQADRKEQEQRQQDKDKADKEKAKKANKVGIAPLDAAPNAGPCPFVKVLYDAARYVEFKGGKEASASVGYTGEIEGIHSMCAYKVDEPITVRADIGFELGKGPTAEGANKVYRYWVAVTDRNREVLAKQYFELPVTFPTGSDRVIANEKLENIVIPRANSKVAGDNFEVLVGFDVSPQMADFNRLGKRFRVNAGQAETVEAGKPSAQ